MTNSSAPSPRPSRHESRPSPTGHAVPLRLGPASPQAQDPGAIAKPTRSTPRRNLPRLAADEKSPWETPRATESRSTRRIAWDHRELSTRVDVSRRDHERPRSAPRRQRTSASFLVALSAASPISHFALDVIPVEEGLTRCDDTLTNLEKTFPKVTDLVRTFSILRRIQIGSQRRAGDRTAGRPLDRENSFCRDALPLRNGLRSYPESTSKCAYATGEADRPAQGLILCCHLQRPLQRHV